VTKLCICVCVCCVKIFYFKKLLRSAGKTGVREMKLKFSELKEFVRPVQNALNVLPAALKVVEPRAVRFTYLLIILFAFTFKNFTVCLHSAACSVTSQNNVIKNNSGTICGTSPGCLRMQSHN